MKGSKAKSGSLLLKYSRLSIILIYNLGTLLGMAIFYRLIPILMGYPKNFFEISRKIGISYDLQYIVFGIISVVVGTLFLLFQLKGIEKWQIAVDDNDLVRLQKIRRKCIDLPYSIFSMQVILVGITVPAIIGVVSFLQGSPLSQFLKISTVVFSLFSLIAVFSLIFSKTVFTKILLLTYNGEGLQGRRIGVKNKIFLQIIPMFLVAILFTSVLGYARLMEEKGNVVYEFCKIQLNQVIKDKNEFKSKDELFEAFKKIQVTDAKISYFVVSKSTDEFTTSDGYIPGTYYKYYSKNPVNGDKVYGDSYDMQGVVTSAKINGEDFTVGVRFENASDNTIKSFLIGLFGLMVLNIFVLNYLSKSFTDEISIVAEGLNDIAEGDQVNLDRKLAVTSNDEIADLVIAFNKIQDREKEHISEIREREAVLSEQQHLACLGQLIGGIAHNLRTPIMSLSGGIEGLKELINEYHNSIGDNEVTADDHFEIVKEMRTWLEKMRPYCTYMSEIISAVKDQTTLHVSEAGLSFTLDELEKRIEILIDHEIRKCHCKLNIDFDVHKSTVLKGEISSLVQVLNNIIVNAAHSYEDNGGVINMKVTQTGKFIEFSISDTGCGIPLEIQKKLFKEMVTTKGKNGTGLGIYMSFSNIKARFGGKMWFESEVGKGTTFHVTIPKKIKDDMI